MTSSLGESPTATAVKLGEPKEALAPVAVIDLSTGPGRLYLAAVCIITLPGSS